MTGTIQMGFDLRLATGRPLFSVNACMGILDRSEDDVLELVEDGRLRWAFDIGHPDASARELRVWRGSVREYANENPKPEFRSPKSDVEQIDEVLRDILGVASGRSVLRGTDLARAFNCSSTHVIGLVECHQLELLRPISNSQLAILNSQSEKPWRRGPGGSPAIARESVCGFLRRRVV